MARIAAPIDRLADPQRARYLSGCQLHAIKYPLGIVFLPTWRVPGEAGWRRLPLAIVPLIAGCGVAQMRNLPKYEYPVADAIGVSYPVSRANVMGRASRM